MLKYQDFALSNSVEEILKEDFWVFTNYNATMFAYSMGAVKFSASASIYVKQGRGRIQISLREFEVTAPAIVSIREGEILQTIECSDDLEASFCVMSHRFTDSLFGMMADVPTMSLINRPPVVPIPIEKASEYDRLYDYLPRIMNDPTITRKFQCILHGILYFYYRVAHSIFSVESEKRVDAGTRLTEAFLHLVQKHFREERFLDFYAEKLGITRKHLSRVIKQQTGISPVNWIERSVILEAKVLLKSSNLTIQQISDTLHFSSQSFFGKHFKAHTGRTPGEFRNQ